MYYKKLGNEPPVIKAGCVYNESYFYDGCLYLKYLSNNVPSETLEEITQEEYEANKPIISEAEPVPQPLSPTEQAIMQTEINTEYMVSLLELKG